MLSNQILAQNTKYSQYSYTAVPGEMGICHEMAPFSSSCFVSLALVEPYLKKCSEMGICYIDVGYEHNI